MTGDRDCAVEATHEAFIRAFERYDTLREPGKFALWVGSIAINIARDIFRTREREVLSTDEELDALTQVHTDAGPEPLVSRNEDVVKLREAVRRLPVDSRSIIILYYLDECSIADIAAMLGIPEGTVKSRLFAARTLLRRMMGQDEAVEAERRANVADCGNMDSQQGRARDLG